MSVLYQHSLNPITSFKLTYNVLYVYTIESKHSFVTNY